MPSSRDHQPDHYAVLGVDPSAAHAVIQQAYRTIMRAAHPDVAGQDAGAAARAVEANAAWAVLRDPGARAAYDRQRMPAARPASVATPGGTPSRPVTIEQLREAAARESAYSRARAAQREDFSAISLRIGAAILLLGAVLLVITVAS